MYTACMESNNTLDGKRVPSVIFKTRVPDEAAKVKGQFTWKDVSSDEIFSGKKIVLFSLPGAFTPTCGEFQLPGYEGQYDELKEDLMLV